MFGLKSEENERLAADLKDTLQQLEDKSAVLMQTQEEKEVSVIGCVNLLLTQPMRYINFELDCSIAL